MVKPTAKVNPGEGSDARGRQRPDGEKTRIQGRVKRSDLDKSQGGGGERKKKT